MMSRFFLLFQVFVLLGFGTSAWAESETPSGADGRSGDRDGRVLFRDLRERIKLAPITGFDVSSTTGLNGEAARGFGLGGHVEFPLSRIFGFEAGLFFDGRQQATIVDSLSMRSTRTWLTSHVLGKVWAGPWVNFGLGGYFSAVVDEGSVGFLGKSFNVDQSQITKSQDAGMMFSVGGHVPFSNRFGLLVDLRYSYGLVNLSRVVIEAFSRQLRTDVGVRFGL